MAVRRLQGNGTAGNKASDSSPQAHLRGPALAYAGKILCRWSHHTPSRLTPAHAGKILLFWLLVKAFRAHPRTCGDNYSRQYCIKASPRLTPAHAGTIFSMSQSGMKMWGLTPAHAGTIPYLSADEAFTAHPRACGDNFPCLGIPCKVKGSPPHMRGQCNRDPVL